MLATLSELYLPFAVTIVVEPGEHQMRLGKVLPFVRSMTMRNGMVTAYVCRHCTCREPVTTVEGLRRSYEASRQQAKDRSQSKLIGPEPRSNPESLIYRGRWWAQKVFHKLGVHLDERDAGAVVLRDGVA